MANSLFYTAGEQQQEPQAHEAQHDDAAQRQAELRARINEGLAHQIATGKGGKSGITYNSIDHAFTGLTADDRNTFYTVPKIFLGKTPAEQMVEMENRTGALLTGADVNASTIHEGMVIGVTPNNLPGNGAKDVLRTGVVYRDAQTQTLMFAESGEDGKLAKRPVQQLLDDAQAHNKTLVAGDLATLADGMGARPIHDFNYDRFFSRFATPDTTPAKAPVDLGAESTLRDRISDGIERYTNDCIRRGVRYGFGDRTGTARIDCSGFIHNAARDGFSDLVDSRGRRAGVTALANCSENQIDNVFRATGTMLRDNEVQADTLRAGMIIGLDTGRKSWDRGRARGIDHIVVTYTDSHTGRLMISESCGGVGVRKMEADQWLEHSRNRYGNRLHLFATDLAEMADGRGLVARADQPAAPATRTARNRAPATTTAPGQG